MGGGFAEMRCCRGCADVWVPVDHELRVIEQLGWEGLAFRDLFWIFVLDGSG